MILTTFMPIFWSHQGDFEAEEYIDGDQFHCEVMFHDGEAKFAFVSRFNGSQLDMMAR